MAGHHWDPGVSNDADSPTAPAIGADLVAGEHAVAATTRQILPRHARAMVAVSTL
jgi:hypothetical protein